MLRLVPVIFSLALMTTFGCNKEKEGKSASVSVTFAKKETAALNASFTLDATEGWVAGDELTTLKIKPIAVGISEALNSNQYMIWGSKNCPGQEHKFEKDDKSYRYSVYEEICAANDNDEYLNMLDPVELNETLNSQSYPVPPGNYKYVTLAFCSKSKTDGVNNLMYRAPEMPEDHEGINCDPFVGYTETGVNVPEGGSVTVKLTYDLDRLVDYLKHSPDMNAEEPGPHDYNCYWTPDGMTQYCPKFGQGSLVPSISE